MHGRRSRGKDERDRHDMTLPSMPEKRHQAVITGNAMVVPSINPVLPKAVRNDSVSTIQWEAPPSNYYKQNPGLVSSCSGQKKALLVGIVYRGSEKVLEGCINDTTIMKKFLVQKFNFNPADIRVLSEDMADTSLHPTRANIIAGFNGWLQALSQAIHLCSSTAAMEARYRI
ncbi:metacaspase-1 [Batrachochytrium salamandrivorans]|nr:metacaspase-1 [Batrachochytrium salamandrivorans]